MKMKQTSSMAVAILAIVVVGAVSIFLFRKNYNAPAQNQNQNPSGGQINTAGLDAPAVGSSSKQGVGDYLTGRGGMTLYYFAGDAAGKSNCNGACAAAWPAFYAPTLSVAPGLNTADFGIITRDGGSEQTTYKGWPLYYYAKDANPGDTSGQGVDGIWFVAANPFYSLLLQNSNTAGIYISDAGGRALYVFAGDTVGAESADPASKCAGACAQTWPPYYAETGSIAVPAGLANSDFTEFTRADGQKQLAYKGYPLYYYSGDTESGDIIGNGFNGVWHLASPRGFKAAAKSPAAATTVRLSPSIYPQVQPVIPGTGLTGITGGGYDY